MSMHNLMPQASANRETVWFGITVLAVYRLPCGCSGWIVQWYFPMGDENETELRGLDECAQCGAVITVADAAPSVFRPEWKG